VIARLAVLAALGLAGAFGGVARADRPAVPTGPAAPTAPAGPTAPTEREDAGGPAHTLAILAVDASSKDLARGFESELESQLGTMSVRVLPRSRLREQMRKSTQWTDGCVVGECLAEVRTQTGVSVVLLGALTGSGTTFGYVITLVRTDTGRVLAQEAGRCDVCTESEATGRALVAAVKVVGAIPAVLPDEAAAQGAAVEVAAGEASRKLAAERRGVRRVGWTLTVLGLAAAGAGAFLYFAGEDRPAHGLAMVAGGGGLAVGGITVLAF
jgi:hypothetical protein